MLFRSLLTLALAIIAAAALCASASMTPSGRLTIVANVRGKRFEVQGETVQEISRQVETLTGIKASEQSVMFRGKVLGAADKLEEVGLTSGEVVNVVKGRKAVRPSGSASKRESTTAPQQAKTAEDVSASSSPLSMPGSFDPAELGADPENLKKVMDQMDKLLDGNVIDEYFSDEERIEEARQQMLANMDQYENMMPGFKEQAAEIASDPIKWKEAMENAKMQLLKMKQQRDSMRAANQNDKHPADSSIDDIADDEE